MRTVLNVADAVVTELNSAPDETFSLEFIAERKVLPEYDLRNITALQVIVVPRSLNAELETRSQVMYEVQIDIGVQKHVGKEIDDEIEDLMDLVEEVGDYLRGLSLTAVTYARWVRMENNPIYSPDHLATHHVFTSVITMTYHMLVEK